MYQHIQKSKHNSLPVKVYILIDERDENPTNTSKPLNSSKELQIAEKEAGNNRKCILDGIFQKGFSEEGTGKLRTKEW